MKTQYCLLATEVREDGTAICFADDSVVNINAGCAIPENEDCGKYQFHESQNKTNKEKINRVPLTERSF